MRRGRDERREEPSLLPSIQEQELLLQEMLKEARAAADRLVQEAEREAAERLRSARAGLPARLEERRREAVARIEAEADQDLGAAAEAIREIDRRAGENLPRAVAAIESAVWPGEGT